MTLANRQKAQMTAEADLWSREQQQAQEAQRAAWEQWIRNKREAIQEAQRQARATIEAEQAQMAEQRPKNEEAVLAKCAHLNTLLRELKEGTAELQRQTQQKRMST